MTSARPSATLYREGVELDDLLAELDEEHPGQVRVVDVTYGREGGVLGFFAKRRVGVRYAVDAHAEAPIESVIDSVEIDEPAGRHSVSPLEDLLSAADAAEAEAMVTHGVAPDGAGDDAPNVEFARMLLDLAMTKANQRRANEEAAKAAFVEPGTHVLPAAEPEPAIAPVAAAAPAATPALTPLAAIIPTVVPAPVAAPVAAPVTAPLIALAAPLPVPTTIAAPPAPRPASAPPAAPAAREIWTAPPRRVSTVPPVAPVASITPRRDPQSLEVADLLRAVRTRPVGAHRAATETHTRTEFTLRRQLAELGVPVSWIPDGAADAYWAIEQLCTRVPEAAALDLAPGSVIVIAGPPAAAQTLAHDLCAQQRINPGALVTAGCNAADLPMRRDVTQRWQARALADETRAARREPVIVAVNTEDPAWAAGIIAELAPDALWTIVDATRKPADLRRLLAGLDRESDALAIVNAASTASPASVWELDIPIALIDGRPASRGTWASLLIDGLAALES